MKKIFSVTALIVLSHPVYAKTTTSDSTSIYCPKEIVCSMDKRVSSCKPVGDNLEYWDKVRDSSPVTKGTHRFLNAYSSYQSPLNYSTTCIYEGMGMQSKEKYLLEALPGSTSAWQLSGYSAICYNDDASLCPLNPIPALNFTMKMKGEEDFSVNVIANGVNLVDYPLYSYSDSNLSIYQAWNGCYDDKVCQLDLVVNDDKGAISIGNVIVDMQNKMQIIKINGTSTGGYELSQGKDKNSIVIAAK